MKITMPHAPRPPTHSLNAISHWSIGRAQTAAERPSKAAPSAIHFHADDFFLLRALLVMELEEMGSYEIRVRQRRVCSIPGRGQCRSPSVSDGLSQSNRRGYGAAGSASRASIFFSKAS